MIFGVASNVLKHLTSLSQYQNAKSISVFLSMPQGEIKTDAIVRRAFHDHKHVFVPYLGKEMSRRSSKPISVMDMVALHSLDDYQALQPDAWGIPSVSHESASERQRCLAVDQEDCQLLDLVILPGVAFDGQARRLGHGKGFYDMFLSRYERTVKAKDPNHPMPSLGMLRGVPRGPAIRADIANSRYRPR